MTVSPHFGRSALVERIRSVLGTLRPAVLGLALSACAPEGPRLEPLPADPFAGADGAVSTELEGARAEIERIAARTSSASSPALARAWGELGRLAHGNELYETAIVAYRNAERLAPRSSVWPYLRGHLELERSRPAEALAAFERTLSIDSADGPAQVARARALRLLGRVDEALALLGTRIEGAPKDAQALLLGAELAAELGRPELAAERFERLLELQPGATRLWLPLGQIYRELGRVEEAERALARRGRGTVVAEDGRLSAVRALGAGTDRTLLQAAAAFRLGRYELAARGFEDAVRRRPDDLELRANLVASLVRMNAVEKANRELVEIFERSSEFAPAWGLLGALHAMQGRDEEAAAALRRSLELDPGRRESRSNLARILLRRGELEEALEMFRALGANDPRDVAARAGEAACLSRLGRHGQARELLERELERLARPPELLLALARLLAAAPEAALRDGERALGLAREVAGSSEDPLPLETLAMALAEQGDFEGARSAQQRALESAAKLVGPERAALVKRFQVNLERYTRGIPCRDPALG